MSDRAACGSLPEISYSAFAERIGERVSAERTPLDGSLELTFRCNLGCAHCYVNEPSGDLRAKHQELTTSEILWITDEVVDLGCLWMLLTGGEVLLRVERMTLRALVGGLGCRTVLMWEGGEEMDPAAVFRDLAGEGVTVMVGGFPHGDFREAVSLADAKVRMGDEQLTAPTIVARVVHIFELSQGIQ